MRTLVAVIALALIGGCATPQGVGSKQPIPVSKVANDLKCELATFLAARSNVQPGNDIFRLDSTQWASGTLTLKTVTTNTYKASVGTAGVLPLEADLFCLLRHSVGSPLPPYPLKSRLFCSRRWFPATGAPRAIAQKKRMSAISASS